MNNLLFEVICVLIICSILIFVYVFTSPRFNSVKFDNPCVQEYNGPIDWEKIPNELKQRSSISPYLPYE